MWICSGYLLLEPTSVLQILTLTDSDTHPCAVADGETQESTERYNEVDLLVRKMLWWRAFKARGVAFANAALVVRDTFVQVCFMAQRADGEAGCPDIHQSAQVGNKLLQAKLTLVLY